MMETAMSLPRYPIYIPSKGRYKNCLTAKVLARDGVPFRLVVEPPERFHYEAAFGADRVFVLPFQDLGQGSIPARNFIWEHAAAGGYVRHWCLDDNIRDFYRRYEARRVRCHAGIALRVCEDFTDRYENVGLSGLNYDKFLPDNRKWPPFWLNCHVYSCILIDTSLPFRWRGRYNEDTDLCLRVLSSGLCTVALNAFCCGKMSTMVCKGGNTEKLYAGDGRLVMAKSLERLWPYVVKTTRKFSRPQHSVRRNWKMFDQHLRRRADIDWSKIDGTTDGYGLVRVEGGSRDG
jgi:hypothetical protein